jgi:hypothetical protein
MVAKIAAPAVAAASDVASKPAVEPFQRVMEGVYRKPAVPPTVPPAAPPKPAAVHPSQRPQPVAHPLKAGAATAAPRAQAVQPVQPKSEAKAALNEVAHAQVQLDHLLKLAESGRTFSPAELIAFQAHAYQASQEIDLASKVVEKATGGVKQVLNTQV